MGITVERHNSHVEEWIKKFQNYKQKWPKHLFRHEPVENALAILRAGVLMSRMEASQRSAVITDIAPEDIIQNRHEAHESVRLYFRPRTPTQFHIEGIRKPADYYKGRHGGFLAVLVFDANKVLTMPQTKFSTGNMQSPYSKVIDGDEGFNELDFAGIYHDEAYPTDDEKKKRCAEVLARSPLPIANNLVAIVVRTDADMSTLKYLLLRDGLHDYIPLIKVGSAVFFNNYTAVQYVDTAPGRIGFKLLWSKSAGDIETEITAYCVASGYPSFLVNGPLKPLQAYVASHTLPAGGYRVIFKLEGCFAHESLVDLTLA